MSAEQAKAVLAQQADLAPPTLIEEDEPAVEEELGDEAEAEAASDERGRADLAEVDEGEQEPQDGESLQPSHGEGTRESGDMPRDGGRGRRRRRRRGRGGRGGEGREGGPFRSRVTSKAATEHGAEHRARTRRRACPSTPAHGEFALTAAGRSRTMRNRHTPA